ncbi:chloride channel protein [Rhodococcus aerolatus]
MTAPPLVRLGGAALLTGVAAGVAGAALTLVLHLAQHAAFGYVDGSFQEGVDRAGGPRRVLALAVGGLVVALGWWLLRRGAAPRPGVPDVLAGRVRRLPVPATVADAVLQVVAVGVGASLGRENAPRQVAAAAAGWWAERTGLGAREQRTLAACGAGAGLAAVYDVPLAGAVFTLEVLLVSAAAADVVLAVVTAALATVVAWPVVGTGSAFAAAGLDLSPGLLVVGVLLGPVAGVVGLGFARLAAAARARPATGLRAPVATVVVLTALGGVAVVLPELLGNGKGPAQLALDGAVGLPVVLVLLVAKPLATAACLRAGVVGGLLTPTFSVGALLGLLVGRGAAALWPGTSVAAVALVGAAAVLGAALEAPLTAVVLAVELTGAGGPVVVPVLLAVAGAVLTRRGVDGRGVDGRWPHPRLVRRG